MLYLFYPTLRMLFVQNKFQMTENQNGALLTFCGVSGDCTEKGVHITDQMLEELMFQSGSPCTA